MPAVEGQPETIMMFGRYEVNMNTFTLVGGAIVVVEGIILYAAEKWWQNRKKK